MTPTFSIIIPVYNVAPYLRECLDSVLAAARTLNEKCEMRNAECGGVEIICVDDGSTDGSGAILDEFQEKIKSAIPNSSFQLPNFIVIHQTNAGSSAARNVGLDHAQGEWVWFVDGDDFVEPNALAAFAALEEKADVTYFSMRVRHADGLYEEKHLTGTGVVRTDDGINQLIESLYRGPLGDVFGWTVDKFIRRNVITEAGIRFDESISFFEDEVFTIRVVEQAHSLATIPDVLYNYRRLGSSLTAKGIPDPYRLAKSFFFSRRRF